MRSEFAVLVIGCIAFVLSGCRDATPSSAQAAPAAASAITGGHPIAGIKSGLKWARQPHATIASGSRLSLSVVTVEGFTPGPNGVMFVCDGDTYLDKASPYEAEFEIPKKTMGPIEVGALALDEATYLAMCDRITINVESTAQVIKLILPSPKIRLFTLLPRKHIEVMGDFDDGILRVLDPTRNNLTFSIADPAIATVEPNGLVHGKAIGSTTLTVTDGTNSTTAELVVQEK